MLILVVNLLEHLLVVGIRLVRIPHCRGIRLLLVDYDQVSVIDFGQVLFLGEIVPLISTDQRSVSLDH